MDNIIISPSKYVQGENSLGSIASYVAPYGNNPMVIADEFVSGLVGETVSQSFIKADMPFSMELFQGECSKEEIKRLEMKSANSDVIIGIGGGKTLDTAKAIGFIKSSLLLLFQQLHQQMRQQAHWQYCTHHQVSLINI